MSDENMVLPFKPPASSEQSIPHNTLTITTSYPASKDYYYTTELKRKNLDKMKIEHIYQGEGFIISESQNIKKDLKDPDGIFSPRFGQGLSDLNPYMDRYSCPCKKTQGSINLGQKCLFCGHKVKFIGDDYLMTGFLQLNEYHIIHPNLYSLLEAFMGPSSAGNGTTNKDDKHWGTKLYNILKYAGEVDQDGKEAIVKPEDLPSDQPFYGIGMIDFYHRFDEIIEYYHKKYPKKEDMYRDIINNRNNIFAQSFPVITTHLRPFDIKSDIHQQTMYFEPLNAMYNLMNSLVGLINKNTTSVSRKKKPKSNLLFDLQMQIQRLYDEIMDIMSGKKGSIRQLTGGRFNFSNRSVIAQDPSLRVDQVKLPYAALCIMLRQKITNILGRLYHIMPSEADQMWNKGLANYDPRIAEIIMSLINAEPEGLSVLINRNRATCKADNSKKGMIG